MSSVPPGFGPSSPGNNPYPYQPPGQFSDPYGPPQPKSNSSIIWIVGIVIGVIGLGGLLACGCCGGLTFFGMNVAADQVADSLRDNPVVVEHLGEIKECNWNVGESFQHDDDDVMVFDVEGSQGSGKIIGELNDNSDGLISGHLETTNGTFDLFPEQ